MADGDHNQHASDGALLMHADGSECLASAVDGCCANAICPNPGSWPACPAQSYSFPISFSMSCNGGHTLQINGVLSFTCPANAGGNASTSCTPAAMPVTATGTGSWAQCLNAAVTAGCLLGHCIVVVSQGFYRLQIGVNMPAGFPGCLFTNIACEYRRPVSNSQSCDFHGTYTFFSGSFGQAISNCPTQSFPATITI